MKEGIEVLEMGGTDGPVSRIRKMDNGLLWVRPPHSSLRGPLPAWSGLDLKMVDLHARYERACMED